MTDCTMLYDVVICTLNSEHKLRECLDAVLREIPVRRIIVVDSGSTDGTLNILRSYSQVELHVRPDLDLGRSRQFSFERVTTDWFFQIDSDVVLQPGWFEMARAWIGKAAAVEFGTNAHYIVPAPLPSEIGTKTYQAGRAMMFNVLFERKALAGVQLTCRFIDDEWIRRQIISRGGSWLKPGTVMSDHYSHPVRYGREGPLITAFKATPYPYEFYEETGFVDGATLDESWSGLRLAVQTAINVFRPVLAIWGQCKRHPVKVIRCYLRGWKRGRELRSQKRLAVPSR